MNYFYPLDLPRTRQAVARRFGSFDDMVSKALGSSSGAPSLLAQLYPWKENTEQTGYVWQMLAAGLDPSEVGVELEDDTVIVSLTSATTRKTVQVSLPHLAKKETLSADLSKGILTLSIDKAEKKRTAIEVKSTDQPSPMSVKGQEGSSNTDEA